jgi:pyruvate,orthophosphate dikinase
VTKYVYDFTEGDRSMADSLGGKGANLAEMTRLGLPVPPGFTITTQACRDFMAEGREPAGLGPQVGTALAATESRSRRRFGDPENPLLVSVRSGARYSMPGMMETVLNIGLNDETLAGLAKVTGDERFAWDSYRRLIQMFGRTVLAIDGQKFEHILDAAKKSAGVKSDAELTIEQLRQLVTDFKDVVRHETGAEFPQGVFAQLDLAIRAVFKSWNTDRAKIYRRQERIADDLGTAVNICTMVFGNRGYDSGTGVAFTRDPATGATGAYGDWLPDAQGEDVVAGIRNTYTLNDLHEMMPKVHADLMRTMDILETHYKDLCDIEFTIEDGTLWMLQTRIGKRTAAAAFRIAVQLVDEGLINLDEALERVTGDQLSQLMFPRFDSSSKRDLIAKGIAASPGAAVGVIAFTSAEAIEYSKIGTACILVRRETNPDDLSGMIASVGILTSRGGKTSHAAVVARGMGKTAVCGADELVVDVAGGFVTTGDGRQFNRGEVISIDGTSGDVFAGEVPVSPSPISRYFDGEIKQGDPEFDDLVEAVDRLVTHADTVRKMSVLANADTGEDAARARRMGACGIGLARTEHMFLGERRLLVERLILSETQSQRDAVFAELLPQQIADFESLLEEMDGFPVIIRLIDPPLHEFLPDLTELAVRVALAKERDQVIQYDVDLLAQVEHHHEQNPMLGMRGVRLGLEFPGLFETQIRAVGIAAVNLIKAGRNPMPEIMVPLVATVAELEPVRKVAEAILAELSEKHGVELHVPIGTMIELPRAALTAHRIARSADFFSFGTNDLTQTTWGFSRDDVESEFIGDYLERGILGTSPFESIDVFGVGELVRIASEKGRSTKPNLSLGVCGEHGGDPASIHFFAEVGLDYVPCSPFRVPIARLEVGRAALIDVIKSESR